MKGGIFDLDGTLVDSLYIWDILAFEYLSSLGLKPNKNIVDEIEDMNLEESSLYLQEKFSIKKSQAAIVGEIKGLLRSYYEEKFLLKPGAKELIQSLYKNGVRLCVATTIDMDLALALLKRLDILKYFDFIQTEDSLGISKREPKFFDLACRRLSTPREETFVFEDAYYALKSASKAGLKLVGIRDETIGWSNEVESLVDLYIGNFYELEEFLNEKGIDYSRF